MMKPTHHAAVAALTAALISAPISGPATAQTVPEGCFARDYSAAHLAANPDQIVDWITLRFYPDPYEDNGMQWADITVRMAHQGRALSEGLAGRVLSETGANFASPLVFGVDCDGGSFEVIRHDADSLMIETRSVRVATGGCGGEIGETASLAETPGMPTRYLLYRADPARCEAP